MKKQILFLHGFLSSGNSNKASILRKYVENNNLPYEVFSPSIDDDITRSIYSIEEFIKEHMISVDAFVGSSLGGYWSYRLFQKFKVPTILINPVVNPKEIIDKFAGKHTNPYTNNEFVVPSDLDNLDMDMYPLGKEDKKKFYIILGTADEVLDYHKALEFYRGCAVNVIENENHRIRDFQSCCTGILEFIEKSANN